MQIEPGCLAVIRPGWGCPEEIGAVVTVLRRGIEGEKKDMRSGGHAACRVSDAWLCDSRASTEFPCFIQNCYLRRIDGAAEDDELVCDVGEPQAA